MHAPRGGRRSAIQHTRASNLAYTSKAYTATAYELMGAKTLRSAPGGRAQVPPLSPGVTSSAALTTPASCAEATAAEECPAPGPTTPHACDTGALLLQLPLELLLEGVLLPHGLSSRDLAALHAATKALGIGHQSGELWQGRSVIEEAARLLIFQSAARNLAPAQPCEGECWRQLLREVELLGRPINFTRLHPGCGKKRRPSQSPRCDY